MMSQKNDVNLQILLDGLSVDLSRGFDHIRGQIVYAWMLEEADGIIAELRQYQGMGLGNCAVKAIKQSLRSAVSL